MPLTPKEHEAYGHPQGVRFFDYDNDKHYRFLLSAWDANTGLDFRFEDHSTPYINSRTPAALRLRSAPSSPAPNVCS